MDGFLHPFDRDWTAAGPLFLVVGADRLQLVRGAGGAGVVRRRTRHSRPPHSGRASSCQFFGRSVMLLARPLMVTCGRVGVRIFIDTLCP